jgi:hypothetical protein
VRLEVSATDKQGRELFRERKRYFQIGMDTEQYMRYGAWQIKEYLDLTLQPKSAQEERFLMHFKKKTNEATVDVTLTYCLSGKKCDVIYRESRRLTYR